MTEHRRPNRRTLLAAGGGLIPLIPIVIALFLSGGGGATGQASAAATRFTPTAVPAKAHQPPARGSLVALVRHATAMRSTPGGHTLAQVDVRTGFGSPQALWVVRRDGSWLGVISPQAGNGRVGWIRQSATALSYKNYKLDVSLSARRLTVLYNGRVERRFTVAVGVPAAPTPTGRFAVTDRLLTGDPSGPYGCCILALSALAPHAIQDWSGGNRIAIHSTPETWTIGQAASHGCLRLTLAEGRWLLAHIPLGTPTMIRT